MAPSSERLRLEIRGVVQGVGFRPYVHALARRHGLSGWVRNDGHGVSIEIQGRDIAGFLAALPRQLPPLARIDAIERRTLPLQPEQDFTIRASAAAAPATALPPDSAICAACLDELFDPQSRYYRYPFLNCSHCGPRYTITHRLPYDRANTAMAGFTLCRACAADYHDPTNRRFHAQPTACPECGPRLSMPVAAMLQRIVAGQILAIKGPGGFQLVCDASNARAVQTLRQRKRRPDKPFAVMVANLASAARWVELDAAAPLLNGPQRPIVLLSQRDDETLAAAVAPGLRQLGVMLPCTPLHYLLFHEAAGRPAGSAWLQQAQPLVLVVTSANLGGEPLLSDNAEAHRRLAGIADAIVDHDRDILTPCDDSVLRLVDGTPRFIRRARGYVPQAIRLPREIPPTLALGGHLKNTVCVSRGDEAFVSQHIGDMDNAATLRFFEQTITQLLALLEVTPERVAHDLHPDFYSSRYARGLGLPCHAVQHHHAHLAAVAAEHHITGTAIGLALDGFGLGTDGGAWGGELLLYDGRGCRRLGHLSPLRQPGGDAAARQPWRMAAAFLQRIGRGDEIVTRYRDQAAAGMLRQLLEKDINCPVSTSAGRLFDTACGLLGIRATASFEGQAPMLLEALVTRPEVMRDGWTLADHQLDFTPLLTRLIDCDPAAGANLFHGTLIAALCDWSARAAAAHDTDTVLLGGGCFLNQVLARELSAALRQRGLRPCLPQQTPPNDGGLSLGQAWVAGLAGR